MEIITKVNFALKIEISITVKLDLQVWRNRNNQYRISNSNNNNGNPFYSYGESGNSYFGPQNNKKISILEEIPINDFMNKQKNKNKNNDEIPYFENKISIFDQFEFWCDKYNFISHYYIIFFLNLWIFNLIYYIIFFHKLYNFLSQSYSFLSQSI